MIRIINKYATVKITILLFGLVLLFNFIIFPMSHKTNAELPLLDLQISYSPQKAYDIIEKYSERERKNYLFAELTLDLIYPIVYSFLFCFIIFLIYKNETLAKFPFLILIFDYAENFGIVTMLYNYPDKLLNIARITSIATSIKWLLVSFSIIIITHGLWSKRQLWKTNKNNLL